MPRRRRILQGLSAAATVSHLPSWSRAYAAEGPVAPPPGTRGRFELLERTENNLTVALHVYVDHAVVLTRGEFALVSPTVTLRDGSEHPVNALIAERMAMISRIPRLPTPVRLSARSEGELGRITVIAGEDAVRFSARVTIAQVAIPVPSIDLENTAPAQPA